MTVKQLRESLVGVPDDAIVRSGRDNGTSPAGKVFYDAVRSRLEIIENNDKGHEKVYFDYGYMRIL